MIRRESVIGLFTYVWDGHLSTSAFRIWMPGLDEAARLLFERHSVL